MEITAIILILALVVLGLALILPLRRALAKKLNTFKATVIDKTTESTMIYTGIFVPIRTNYLITEGGRKVKANKTAFDTINVGDTIVVSRYSDGSYRLEQP